MDILLDELLVRKTGKFRMGLDVLVCDLRRLLHHVSEVTCHGKSALALADRALDEEDLSSHRCPCQTGHHSRSLVTLLNIMRISRKSQILTKMRRFDSLVILLAESQFLHRHTAYLGNLLLKSTHSRFTGIILDDTGQRILSKTEIVARKTMFFLLLRKEISLRDLHLLLSKITADVYHLHTVPEGRLDGLYIVCSRDEQHIRKVVVDIQIIVVESGVLLRIESLEKS